ncbi:MAG: HAD family hydrolase [Phycisphaerae bacterium]
MTRRAVIFDMDGVLIDSYDAHLKSWMRMAQNRGLEMTEEMFASSFGQTNRTIIPQHWPECDNPSTIRDISDEKEAAFREILHESFPEMPGAGDLLRRLGEAGFALAVGSSGPTENVQAVLEELPHAELISARVTGSDVSHGKPHPEVFLAAAEKLRIAPEDCLVVEDAAAGVEAARRAGMACIALTGTTSAEVLEQRGAHRVVDSLEVITPAGVTRTIDENKAQISKESQ